MPTPIIRPVSREHQHGSLTVAHLPIETVKPDPQNARIHSRKQVRQIAKSIESFGFNVPLLIDAHNTVIAGHGRLLACQHLGWTQVPVIRLEHLSDAQRRAFMIADNRLTEIAAWDDGLLGQTLKDLATLELDFDLEVTGFEMAEIDLRIESLAQPDLAPSEPEITAVDGPAVSRMGDLWLLGRHRVLCGSALDAAAFSALFGSEKCAVVFTDPPYNVPIVGHVSGLGKVQHREFPMAVGEMDPIAFTGFLNTFLDLAVRFSHAGGLVYVCMDWRHLPELLAASSAVKLETLNLCVWTKPAAGMGSFYRSQHELVYVFRNGAERHRNNVQLGRHGRNRTNVWPYAAGPGFGRAGEEGHLAALHPTVKPIAMVADAILDCSRRGDIVLDPFLGSGTTLMAAERVGRRCYGLELDPLYTDVIVRRWQAYTGDTARHATSARTFDETARMQEAAR
ncbi:MAG: modification methylase [Hyphomicrobiales bacterium]|nr:modification methylase [Hyphomicrobiales bacterium]